MNINSINQGNRLAPWATDNQSGPRGRPTEVGNILQQIRAASQDRSTNANSVLNSVLEALGNSEDPALQEIAAEFGDQAQSTGQYNNRSASDILRDLVDALKDYQVNGSNDTSGNDLMGLLMGSMGGADGLGGGGQNGFGF